MRPILAVLLLSGCASDTLTIKRAPRWVEPTNQHAFDTLALTAEIRAEAPGAYVVFTDATYTLLSANWVRAYTAWTEDAAKAVGLSYTAESFDCENFVNLFAEIARKKAGDANIHTAPLVAKVTIRTEAGLHAIVGAATDEGIFLIEPQPTSGLKITPLAQFKHPILRVDL